MVGLTVYNTSPYCYFLFFRATRCTATRCATSVTRCGRKGTFALSATESLEGLTRVPWSSKLTSHEVTGKLIIDNVLFQLLDLHPDSLRQMCWS